MAENPTDAVLYAQPHQNVQLVIDETQDFDENACDNIPTTSFIPQVYKLNRENFGKAIIINTNNAYENVEINDVKRLQKQLESIGFTVESYYSGRIDKINKILEKVAKEFDSKFGCFAVFMLYNATRKGDIIALDIKEYKVENIFAKFVGSESGVLIGKPKLFFMHRNIKTTRPQNPYISLLDEIENNNSNAQDSNDMNGNTIPSTADLLIVLSTYKDSNPRYTDKGPNTCFISYLCKELDREMKRIEKNRKPREIQSILTRISAKVSQKIKEIPIVHSMLTKEFYLAEPSQ